MKLFRLWFFLGLILLTVVSCSKIEEDPFPSMREVTGTQAGEITWKTDVIDIKNEKYRVDFGILNVLEIREKTGSRPIHLPVVRVHAMRENSSEPVFLLARGPGKNRNFVFLLAANL